MSPSQIERCRMRRGGRIWRKLVSLATETHASVASIAEMGMGVLGMVSVERNSRPSGSAAASKSGR